MLVSIDQLDEAEKRFVSSKSTPMRSAPTDAPEEVHTEGIDLTDVSEPKGTILNAEENLKKRKAMIEAVSTEPSEFAFERAIGKNDSVYSNFVELIADAKRRVGRIVVKNGNKAMAYATGFLVSENLLLTNWHVFRDISSVAESEVQFFYELDTRGNPGPSVSFKLEAGSFFYSFKDLDYCFVAVSATDVTGTVGLDSIGYIFLDPALGKLGNEEEELLNIIHHPDGDYKQLSIRENRFTKILETSIWYESDTSQGSSGSPVFNDQWQVVALHHMGIASRNDQGEYIDKHGKVIPKIGNSVDVSKIHWIANEGIRTSVILKDIFGKFPESPFINKLKAPPSGSNPMKGNTNESIVTTNNAQTNTPMESSNNNVHISFPSSLIEANGNISININTKGSITGNAKPLSTLQSGEIDEDFTEAKKIDIENEMDFSACKGYIKNFLGVEVELPMPLASQNKFIAKLKSGDGTVLKYHHYSVILHAVRMMPVMSAINVDGDVKKRLDETKRGTDVWYRDNRIDYDIQLSDKYYKGSGFDRGHMSRREDANWGKTAEDARLFADMTCMYTNACPQINTLNQSSRKGLWGKLEMVVLENGAIQERGKTAKISVFNGPIFKESDGVFRGIQVPLEFFKIILWLNDDGELKATGFKLSQADLVGDIDFEAIDIDQNVEFREYQCSIKSLQTETKIDFSKIVKFDTFDGGDNESLLASEEELKAVIGKHRKSRNQ